MTEPSVPFSHPLRVADLPTRKATRIDLTADDDTLTRIAGALSLTKLGALRLTGEIRPEGRRDWVLDAVITATAVQPCVVTLSPVTTEIREKVTRRYLADMSEPEGEEVEMPEDDSSEPLPSVIDAGAVAVEALALALPLYPRAEGAELGESQFAEPGVDPIRDEDLRPFAGLADLLRKTEDKG